MESSKALSNLRGRHKPNEQKDSRGQLTDGRINDYVQHTVWLIIRRELSTPRDTVECCSIITVMYLSAKPERGISCEGAKHAKESATDRSRIVAPPERRDLRKWLQEKTRGNILFPGDNATFAGRFVRTLCGLCALARDSSLFGEFRGSVLRNP